MKNTRILRAGGAAILAAALSLAYTPKIKAADLIYTVVINTSSLIGNPDAPFSLDLDLVTGSGNAVTGAGNVTNTVTLSKFTFTGGATASSPNFTMGGQSGSVSSSVVLTNSSANNEFAIAFTTIPTQIVFTVDETTNSEVVGSGTPIPDQFAVYLDNNAANGFVPTTDPSGSNTLISSTIVSGMTINSIQAYSSTAPDAGVTAVPEPGSAALLLFGAVGLVARRKRAAKAA